MTGTAIRLATLAIAACVAFSPSLVRAAGTETPPPPPPSDSGKSKSKDGKKSFLDGYQRAYAAIYQRHDYATGIAQLKALNRNDHADVANLIGYSSRKLGNYEEFEGLVRGGAEGRPEPRPHVAVLRPVAARAGQPGAGQSPPRQDRLALRHVVPRVQVACRSDGHGRRRRTPDLLIPAEQTPSHAAEPDKKGLAPRAPAPFFFSARFCRRCRRPLRNERRCSGVGLDAPRRPRW